MLVARKSSKSHDSHGKIVYECLLLGRSPENISGRMRVELPAISLSHTTIYRRIAADKANGGDLFKMLPRFGKRSREDGKRGKAGVSSIPNRVDMNQRPEIVNQCTRIGDFKEDTIHRQQGNLVTVVGCTSRLVLIGKVSNRTASEVTHTINNLLKRVNTVHTITLNNGGEFAQHSEVRQSSRAKIYFARPYASYQRGTNENTKGLIRRHWPKKTLFNTLANQQMSDIELPLNMMPRKVLGGLTPLEAYTGARVA